MKIKYESVDGECKTETSHAVDLVDIFGTEIMQEIDAERTNKFHLIDFVHFYFVYYYYYYYYDHHHHHH